MTELALGGNVALSDVTRYSWKTQDNTEGIVMSYCYCVLTFFFCEIGNTFYSHPPVVAPRFVVELQPMEIRTFNVTVDTSLI